MNTIKWMKLLAAVLALGALGACGRDGGDIRPVAQGDPIRIEITGDDRMRFSPTEFEVTRNQPVTLVFRNIGTMPKESMGHNVAILQQGVGVLDFAAAGARHVRNEYIDPARENQVIIATPIIGPNEVSEATFVAPADAGDYDFLCTFPGHAAAGMVGVMRVR